MQSIYIWLLLSLAWFVAEGKDVICKGKRKLIVKIGEGDSSIFKVQNRAKKTKCSVTFKKENSCPLIRFNCTCGSLCNFDLNNNKARCSGLDRMVITMDNGTKKYCQMTGPDIATSGFIKVSYFSKKKSKSRATCKAECVSPTTTTTTTPTTTTTTTKTTTTTSAGVCGSDNITYESTALATSAQATILCDWACPCESAGTVRVEEEGAVYLQNYQLKMSEAGRTLKIEVEPHNNVTATTVIFQTEEGNPSKWSETYLLKLGRRCFLTVHMDPGIISQIVNGLRLGSESFSRLNQTIIDEEEQKSYRLIRTKNKTKGKVSKEMLEICPDEQIIQVEEFNSNLNEYAALDGGKVVISELTDFQLNNNSDCEIRSALTFEDPAGGCYHWINPGSGDDLSTHEYVTWVDTAYCCYTYPGGDPACCDNIIDNWLWNDLIAPDSQGNFCRCEDITSSVMFNICFEGTVG